MSVVKQEQEGLLIFAKNDKGQILVRSGEVLSQNLIPFRQIKLKSKKVTFEGDAYVSEIQIYGNNNNLAPGLYKVVYVHNLLGVEECEYKKVDLSKHPLLRYLNMHFCVLFGVW